MFCPKPNSPCLEYSSNGDGCAVFWKISKLHVNSWKVELFFFINHFSIFYFPCGFIVYKLLPSKPSGDSLAIRFCWRQESVIIITGSYAFEGYNT